MSGCGSWRPTSIRITTRSRRAARDNARAFEAAFLDVLLMARESGLLKLGTVSIDGTKIDANASKIRSVRDDRMVDLRKTLSADIAALTAKAETTDAEDAPDPQALPRELARRETLKAKLDAACARLEAAARAEHVAAKAEHETKTAVHAARTGRRGTPPVPPEDGPDGNGPPPAPERQSNLTDPDSALMRKSARHEYRQAYNAQAVVDAEGSQLIVATNMATTPTDQPSFAATILAMEAGIGLPKTVLADAGFASREPVGVLQALGIDPLVATGATQDVRPYDVRPPPDRPKRERTLKEPWRVEMQAKMNTEPAKTLYRLRKQTVEPVFGIIKAVLGFRQFRMRGLAAVKAEWTLRCTPPVMAALDGIAHSGEACGRERAQQSIPRLPQAATGRVSIQRKRLRLQAMSASPILVRARARPMVRTNRPKRCFWPANTASS